MLTAVVAASMTVDLATPCHRTDKGLNSVFSSQARPMRYTSRIKPISYLKANAAEVLDNLQEAREPLIITQNGEAKAVIQDILSYEETQETLALLKLLALGRQEAEAGKLEPMADTLSRLRDGLGTAE